MPCVRNTGYLPVTVVLDAPREGPNPRVAKVAIGHVEWMRFDRSARPVAVAGSVGVGLADRWSDLELDCYWREPPSDEDRRRPIRALGADLESFWDYDEDEEEWSEVYHLGPLAVTISNFTVTTVERFLDAVLNDSDLDPVKHYRLAAIGTARALRGARTVDTWRERARHVP